MSTSPSLDNNLSTDERLRVEFNDWAKAGRGPSMEKGHRPVGAQAIARMNIPADARVLDIGCGSGWAARLMAEAARKGRVVGIDISDEMVHLARSSSGSFANVQFQVKSAEKLSFAPGEFSHAFSMESLYYYANMLTALEEIHRVLEPGGLFVTVVDMYQESEASHQWVETLKVPVHLLSVAQYRDLFQQAGFINIIDERLYDPAPIVEHYSGTSFKTHEDYVSYRKEGSLMVSGEVKQ